MQIKTIFSLKAIVYIPFLQETEYKQVNPVNPVNLVRNINCPTLFKTVRNVMNIFLIGYRCSGKTETGKLIAGILNSQFIDTDLKIVEEEGMTISEIVDKKGWDFFREKETDVLKKVCMHDKLIVATGGGIVLNEENVINMKKSGNILWLRATFSTVKKRIMHDSKTKDFRPSLTSKELDEEIKGTLLLRKPYYEKAMEISIDTDNLDINSVCKAVITNLGLQERL